MNIAIFTNNYLPNPYGVTGSIESFRKELERRGHSVFVFAPKYKDYTDSNPNVFRYPSLDITYKFRFPLPSLYSHKAARALKDLDIDIIHAQHPTLLGAAARRWAKKKHVPLVFTWHTLYNHYAHFGPPIIGQWYVKRLIRETVRYADDADVVIIPSVSAQRITRGWGLKNSNTFVLPTGVDPSSLAHPDARSVRKEFDIPDNARIIVTISRFTEEKNIRFLFDAVLPVLHERQNVHFLCAGGGNLTEQMVERAREEGLEQRVHVSGEISRTALKDYLACGDIFAYASKSETQGIIIGEAMYMGLPVVAVRANGVQDSIMDKVTGILVGENREQFSRELCALLKDKEKRNRIGRKAKEIAHTSMTNDVSTTRLLQIYESVL